MSLCHANRDAAVIAALVSHSVSWTFLFRLVYSMKLSFLPIVFPPVSHRLLEAAQPLIPSSSSPAFTLFCPHLLFLLLFFLFHGHHQMRLDYEFIPSHILKMDATWTGVV